MRPTWDEYFRDMAKLVATRATCPRASVGAVLVRDTQVLASGYNGVASGRPHCSEVGCTIVDNHCLHSIHAEINVIGQAARRGVSTDGATMYIHGLPPCPNCEKAMLAAGIKGWIYDPS